MKLLVFLAINDLITCSGFDYSVEWTRFCVVRTGKMSRLFMSSKVHSVSTRVEKQAKSAVKQCFSAVEPRII